MMRVRTSPDFPNFSKDFPFRIRSKPPAFPSVIRIRFDAWTEIPSPGLKTIPFPAWSSTCRFAHVSSTAFSWRERGFFSGREVFAATGEEGTRGDSSFTTGFSSGTKVVATLGGEETTEVPLGWQVFEESVPRRPRRIRREEIKTDEAGQDDPSYHIILFYIPRNLLFSFWRWSGWDLSLEFFGLNDLISCLGFRGSGGGISCLVFGAESMEPSLWTFGWRRRRRDGFLF